MEKKNFVILLASTVIAVFLGSFCASMVIFGHNNHKFYYHIPFFARHMASPMMPPEFERAVDQNEKMMEQQDEFFDKMENDFENAAMVGPLHPLGKIDRNASFVYMANAGVHTEETKDFYKIVIDLKPFNNDAKNVSIKVDGNTLKISAKYRAKDKNDYEEAQIYQSLMLPSKIDSNKIKKIEEGHNFFIIVPKETSSK